MAMVALVTDRIDTWMVIVSVGFLCLCVAVLVLLNLLHFAGRKLGRERRAVRESPEPGTFTSRNDPQRLERACAGMEETLAQMYMDLAESWLRAGQRQQATAVWQKIVERCPETPQAQTARERLREANAIATDERR
jgi:hypothetical protein